ncbi:MAG: hypothetical protein CYPHOPRED_000313 [Cyphobasidiales sp. Tagirdzhanova-0007]|nr:MAG: hypothetical protein CYPHOPRED_000313 [Cyphobasidiales sp. Tagirdzhanova-0007]
MEIKRENQADLDLIGGPYRRSRSSISSFSNVASQPGYARDQIKIQGNLVAAFLGHLRIHLRYGCIRLEWINDNRVPRISVTTGPLCATWGLAFFFPGPTLAGVIGYIRQALTVCRVTAARVTWNDVDDSVKARIKREVPIRADENDHGKVRSDIWQQWWIVARAASKGMAAIKAAKKKSA